MTGAFQLQQGPPLLGPAFNVDIVPFSFQCAILWTGEFAHERGQTYLRKSYRSIVEALQSFDEKDRTAILKAVCSHLEIDLGIENSSATANQNSSSAASKEDKIPTGHAASRNVKQGVDIKQLKEEKKPSSARQMACLVAYYLQELAPDSERKDSVNTKDLEKYFKQAGFKLPSKLEQLLVDSKGSGYFESSKRGEYSLTRVGYNLVAHSLPGKDRP